MSDHVAQSGIIACVGAAAFDWVAQINVVLHIVTLLVGIAAGSASALYYWRKARHLKSP